MNMKLKKYFFAFAILLGVAVILLVLMATVFVSKPTEQMARQAVENYAKIEFELGDPEKRQKIIKFSPRREAELRKESPKEWVYVTFGYYDRIVVSSYTVGEIKVTGTRATAELHYRRLAHAVGDADESWHLTAEPAHDETVTLNLVFDQGWRPPTWSVPIVTAARNFVFTENQWWALDPPSPRISKQRLLESYEGKIKEYSSTWERELNDPNYSAKQKANVRASRDKATGNLRFLKSLP